MASFTWRAFFEKLNPVAILLAAVAGYFGLFPKFIFLGIIIWQILTKGATLWAALISFFTTIYGWIKGIFVKK